MASADHSIFYTGIANATSDHKLIGNGFLYLPNAFHGGDMARSGMRVYNATKKTSADVFFVDSDTSLTISENIMEAGDSYQVGYSFLYGDDQEIEAYSNDGATNLKNCEYAISFLHTKRVSTSVPMVDWDGRGYMDSIQFIERLRYPKTVIGSGKIIGVTFDWLKELITYDCACTIYEAEPQAIIPPYFHLCIPGDASGTLTATSPTVTAWPSTHDYTVLPSCKGVW